MLRVLNLKKAFGGHDVLTDVSFEIADRAKVALLRSFGRQNGKDGNGEVRRSAIQRAEKGNCIVSER